jgi:hypothetical protein
VTTLSLKDSHKIVESLAQESIVVNYCWRYSKRHRPDTQYGVINIEGKEHNVHRLSAYLFLQLDLKKSNQLACHKDECSFRDCWNPAHLYVGSKSSNALDAIRKQGLFGFNKRNSKCKKCGRLKEGDNLYLTKQGWSCCKFCLKVKSLSRRKS